MTATPQLIDANGYPFPLDAQLGSGGEGAVFSAANDPNVAVKVYHQQRRSPELFQKLQAMVAQANPRLLAVATWPTGLLFDARSRQPVGFSMPKLTGYQEIWRLYHPVERLNFFPRAGWRFQVRAAFNLAAAFDEVHRAGCVIGDVQLRNAHVAQQHALVRLVDCDSFQVTANGRQYLCEVGLPHYIPPELQGKPLRGLVRTQNHDRFGLAVLLYQLLFVGRHPYAGVYRGSGDPSFEELITQFRFAQGPQAKTWGMDPPPYTPTFADIPPDVGMLFRRAFERGSETGTRPQPSEWLTALQQLEQNMAECAADPGHQYSRSAKGCVWCQIATGGGPEYFFGVSSGASEFTVDEAKLQEVLRQLKSLRPNKDEFEYDRERYLSAEPPEGEALPEGLHDHHTTVTILSVVTGLCVLITPLGFVRGFIAAIGFLGATAFGIWLALLYWFSEWAKERRRRWRALERERVKLQKLENEWDRAASRYHNDFERAERAIRLLASDCRELAKEYQYELKKLASNAEDLARLRHLRLHLLADADIPNVSTKRKQALAAHNIFTAAEVNEDVIISISGFGGALTANLMRWKAEVLRKFRFDPATGVSPGDLKSQSVKFRAKQQRILKEIDQKLQRCQSLRPECRKEIEELLPEIREVLASWEQASADVRMLKRKG